MLTLPAVHSYSLSIQLLHPSGPRASTEICLTQGGCYKADLLELEKIDLSSLFLEDFLAVKMLLLLIFGSLKGLIVVYLSFDLITKEACKAIHYLMVNSLMSFPM